jgi:hypothetical protein
MSVVPALQRSFQQHPLAHVAALQSGEPLLLALELLLAPPLELLLPLPLLELLLVAPPLELLLPLPPLELLLVFPPPDVDELVDPPATLPPLPPEPSPALPPNPPLLTLSNSLPVAQATSARLSVKYQSVFFIWAPLGPRRC